MLQICLDPNVLVMLVGMQVIEALDIRLKNASSQENLNCDSKSQVNLDILLQKSGKNTVKNKVKVTEQILC